MARYFWPRRRLFVQREPGQTYPLALHTEIPPDGGSGSSYRLSVSQRDAREQVLGGASVDYRIA